MKLLIDTNVVIKLEVLDPGVAEEMTSEAFEIQRLAQLDSSIALVVHPAIHADIDRDGNRDRQQRHRFLVTHRYHELRSPPGSDEVEAALGAPTPGSGDWVDQQLIAAVLAGAADYLVTEDASLRSRANRLAGREIALSIASAIEMLRSLFDSPRVPPPTVVAGAMYSLDLVDPIWDSFREDYEGFDAWFARSRSDESRHAWWIEGAEGLSAVMIVKPEDGTELGIDGRVLKISSFKVSESARGLKLGELLLKTVFDFIHANSYQATYVTVFPHHEVLLNLLVDFGFRARTELNARGELVVVKSLVPAADAADRYDALEFHMHYGPPAIHPVENNTYIIPIQPGYHDLLFPELVAAPPDDQLLLDLDIPLPAPTHPFGNAIKKAYLSNSSIRSLSAGALVLFYRSHDLQAVTVAGVVEAVRVSDNPGEVAAFVGPRTVYSFEEISEMCSRGEVVAVLFRQNHPVSEPIDRDELVANGALRAAPQSITSVREEAVTWIRARIGP